MNRNIKNLKNNIDFINLDNSNFSFLAANNDSKKFKFVENKTNRKNNEIIFNGILSLFNRIFDLNWYKPKKQNNKKLRLIIKFPRIKLIGNKEKTIFINELELSEKFSFEKAILTFYTLF
tara:strand:+ start:90 stop:449 length:360 start_codon:yes stop_codon:yes gene_type:complete